MFIRKAGIVLLGAGFVMLVVAALIRDPTALDANIGAGALMMAGIPLGTIGLATTIAGAGYEAWSTRASRRAGSQAPRA